MGLTDVKVRKAEPRAKPYRLSDGNGLYLMISPVGGKYWQYRYRFVDREKVFSLGVYPEVTLAAARDGRDAARALIRLGKDPAGERKLNKARAILSTENALQPIAMEWLDKRSPLWTARHSAKVLKRLTQDIFPILGNRPIREILPMDLLMCLRTIESRGANYTAHRTQQIVGQIFRYAVSSGRAERDITFDLRGALAPAKKRNYSRLSANELPEFLNKLGEYDGEPQTKRAVKLLMLTFVRTIELRGAAWKEFDFQKAEWRVPASRMKMRQEHIVPLSRQAIEILSEQFRLTGNYEHVFPNRNRPKTFISENTIIFAIYRVGYHSRTTAHGFRGMASTILHEQGFNTEVIERQLAHGDRNAVRASYNHAAYLPARREMMQWWSNYLENVGLAP